LLEKPSNDGSRSPTGVLVCFISVYAGGFIVAQLQTLVSMLGENSQIMNAERSSSRKHEHKEKFNLKCSSLASDFETGRAGFMGFGIFRDETSACCVFNAPQRLHHANDNFWQQRNSTGDQSAIFKRLYTRNQ
jgi:hypothetical protein